MSKTNSIKVSYDVAKDSVENWAYNTLKLPRFLIEGKEEKKEALDSLIELVVNGFASFKEDEGNLIITFDNNDFVFKNRLLAMEQQKLDRYKTDGSRVIALLGILTQKKESELYELDSWKTNKLSGVIQFFF